MTSTRSTTPANSPPFLRFRDPSSLLVFLDTNVVQSLHTFGEFIYDGYLDPRHERRLSVTCVCAKGRPCRHEDVLALRDLAVLGQRNGWPLAVSTVTMGELGATKDPDQRRDRVSWCQDLMQYFQENYERVRCRESGNAYCEILHFTHLQRQFLYQYLNVLPDENDRILIVDALDFGCNVFLTMDYKTIWRHRAAVRKLGLHVMRPSELLREPVFR